MFCARHGKIPMLLATMALLLWFPASSSAHAGGSPTLAGGRVTPDNAAWGSAFIFEVTYTDNENHPPAPGYPKLYIDNQATEMMENDPADIDFTDGKVYEYHWTTKKQEVGTHKFYFYAENARDPSTGEYAGPSVTVRLTSLTSGVDNPKPTTGETVTFSGCLRTSDDNQSVAGENLILTELLFENEFTADSSVTDENGGYAFSLEAPSPGIHVYRIRFIGGDYYGTSESSRLYVSTLDVPPVLGVIAAVLLVVVGILFFLLSRGMVKAHYLKPVLIGCVLGIFLNLVGVGFISILAAGGLAGFLSAKEIRGWTKYLRVGCMAGFMLMLILGVIYMYTILEYPELFFGYSVTQADMFLIFFYQTFYSLVLFAMLAGFAAIVGGVLRGGLKAQAVERSEQSFGRS